MTDKKLMTAKELAHGLRTCRVYHTGRTASHEDVVDVIHAASIIAADRIAVRADERAKVVEAMCAFIKRWSTTPGRNASIYTAHELERAIRAEFGGKTDD